MSIIFLWQFRNFMLHLLFATLADRIQTPTGLIRALTGKPHPTLHKCKLQRINCKSNQWMQILLFDILISEKKIPHGNAKKRGFENMKKLFIAASFMVIIIAVRMILSVAFGEHVAEVFCKVSISFLFFYFICGLSKSKLKATN